MELPEEMNKLKDSPKFDSFKQLLKQTNDQIIINEMDYDIFLENQKEHHLKSNKEKYFNQFGNKVAMKDKIFENEKMESLNMDIFESCARVILQPLLNRDQKLRKLYMENYCYKLTPFFQINVDLRARLIAEAEQLSDYTLHELKYFQDSIQKGAHYFYNLKNFKVDNNFFFFSFFFFFYVFH